MNRIKLDRDVEERIVSKRCQWADRGSSGLEKPCAGPRRCDEPRAQARRGLRARLRSGRVTQTRGLRHPFGDGGKFAVCRIAELSPTHPTMCRAGAEIDPLARIACKSSISPGPIRSSLVEWSRIDRCRSWTGSPAW
jgi:hypothetical protein